MKLEKIENWLLAAAVFCFPFNTGIIYTPVMKTDLILATDAFLGALYVLWAYRTNLFTRGRIVFETFAVPAVLTILWSIMSMFYAVALRAAGEGVYMLMKSFLLYFYLVNNVTTRSRVLLVANSLVASLLFQAGVGVMQKVLGRPLGLAFLGEQLGKNYAWAAARMRGTLGFPNQYGAFLILIMPLAMSMAIAAKKSLYKLILIGTSVLSLLALLLSLSRSSWLGFFVAMGVFAVLFYIRGLLKPKYIVAVFAFFLLFALIAIINLDVIKVRFETGADGRWRKLMLGIAFPIIRDHPIFGVGLNNYQWHSYDQFKFWHPVHNTFLRLAAETGIPGLLIFLGMLYVLFRENLRLVRINDRLFSVISTGILSGYVAFLVAVQFGPQYQHYRIKLVFWALAGLTFAMKQIKKREIFQQRKLRKVKLRQAAAKQTEAETVSDRFKDVPINLLKGSAT